MVTQVIARGLLVCERAELRDMESGEPVATPHSSIYCSCAGGCNAGAHAGEASLLARQDDAPGDLPGFSCEIQKLPRAMLLYRLSGEYRSLHARPSYARGAGLDRPILHGRCTFGVACHALLRRSGYDAVHLTEMAARFTALAFRGDTIRTKIWNTDDGMLFRAHSFECDRIVLDRGSCRLWRRSQQLRYRAISLRIITQG